MNSNEITIKQAQKAVDGWIKDIGVKYFSELSQLAQLIEGVGETSPSDKQNIWVKAIIWL